MVDIEPKESQERSGLVPRREGKGPGAASGIELSELERMATGPGAALITCIDYGPDHHQRLEVSDLADFMARHRPEWSAVRWINVDGLSDLKAIQALAAKYHLHPLAIEDVLHVPQRPKFESYEASSDLQARLFIVTRALRLKDGT